MADLYGVVLIDKGSWRLSCWQVAGVDSDLAGFFDHGGFGELMDFLILSQNHSIKISRII
jgi:hypothetical protein